MSWKRCPLLATMDLGLAYSPPAHPQDDLISGEWETSEIWPRVNFGLSQAVGSSLTLATPVLGAVELPALPENVPVEEAEEDDELPMLIVTGEFAIDRFGETPDDLAKGRIEAMLSRQKAAERAQASEEAAHPFWHASFWSYLPAMGSAASATDDFNTPSYLRPQR